MHLTEVLLELLAITMEKSPNPTKCNWYLNSFRRKTVGRWYEVVILLAEHSSEYFVEEML